MYSLVSSTSSPLLYRGDLSFTQESRGIVLLTTLIVSCWQHLICFILISRQPYTNTVLAESKMSSLHEEESFTFLELMEAVEVLPVSIDCLKDNITSECLISTWKSVLTRAVSSGSRFLPISSGGHCSRFPFMEGDPVPLTDSSSLLCWWNVMRYSESVCSKNGYYNC